MRAKLFSILTCCVLLAALALVAQEIPSDELFWTSRPYSLEIASAPVIRVQSDLVEVAAVVRDSHEKPVGNLKKEDFLLSDNGKAQIISTFVVQGGAVNATAPASGTAPGAATAAPPMESRYVALFFDDVNTTMPNLNFAREAAIKFVKKGLDPSERVGIFTATNSLTLDFTDDVQKLLETLAKLRLFQRMRNQAMGACPPLGPYEAWIITHIGGHTEVLKMAAARAVACGCTGGSGESCARNEASNVTTVVEDYSLDTLHTLDDVIRHLGKMPGRRVLLVTSSGFLALSFHQQTQKIIEAAIRANVVINALDTAGVLYDDEIGTHFNMKSPLYDMAEGTGGKFIYNNNDLATGMGTLSAEPSVSYLLGFSPTDLKVDGSEHKLKVKLAVQEHLSVSARPSYYAPSAELSPAEKRFHKLQENVMASETRAEIPIQFTATPEAASDGSLLKILVHVDVRKLQFREMGDRKVERLIFITAVFDEKNQFLTGVQGVMDLRVKVATLKQIFAQGLDAKMSIQAPAGSYRVRQVVQEAVDGKLAAVNRMVEVK